MKMLLVSEGLMLFITVVLITQKKLVLKINTKNLPKVQNSNLTHTNFKILLENATFETKSMLYVPKCCLQF